MHSSMKTLIAIVVGMLVQLAHAAELTGHYGLHGITDVGSEILLKPDGTYQAILVYGAVDIESSGSWQQKNNQVELKSAEHQPSLFSHLIFVVEDEILRPQDSPLSEGYYQKE